MSEDKVDLIQNAIIRPITKSDTELLEELFDSLGKEGQSLFNRQDHNRRGALKYCASPLPCRRYWVMESDGIALGYVFFLDWDTGIPTLGVAVRENMRGLGLGRRLTEFALKEAKAEGRGGVMLTTHVSNLAAQSLYESLGFRLMGIYNKNVQELLYLISFRVEV
jgi:ribosomal protein S18 acetylase RimI-like enzyme